MERYQSIGKTISKITAAILALVVICFIICLDENCRSAFKNDYPSEEEYAVLKQYATNYARTLDKRAIPSNSTIMTQTIEEDKITITLVNSRCIVQAEYPIKFDEQSDGKFVTTISYQEGIYECSSNVDSVWFYIIALFVAYILSGMISYYLTYAILVLILLSIMWISKKFRKKIKTKWK